MNLENVQSVKEFIPANIGSLSIRKLTWDDFQGEAEYTSPFNAHIFWHIIYTFHASLKCNKTRKIYYFVQVKSEVVIKNKSWVKKKSDDLLSHE